MTNIQPDPEIRVYEKLCTFLGNVIGKLNASRALSAEEYADAFKLLEWSLNQPLRDAAERELTSIVWLRTFFIDYLSRQLNHTVRFDHSMDDFHRHFSILRSVRISTEIKK